MGRINNCNNCYNYINDWCEAMLKVSLYYADKKNNKDDCIFYKKRNLIWYIKKILGLL